LEADRLKSFCYLSRVVADTPMVTFRLFRVLRSWDNFQ
jgi:hypothetical protein